MTDLTLTGIFSILTAVSTGTFSIIVRQGRHHGNAYTGVLIGLIVSIPLLVLLCSFTWQSHWWNLKALFLLSIAGFLGPAVGRVLYFSGIHYLGVSRAMPLTSTMPLFASIFGVMLLGERPGPFIWLGTILIVTGCISITYKKDNDSSWNRKYIWIPFLAVLSLSLSHVFRKTGVRIVDSPLLAITIMSISGFLFLVLFSRFFSTTQRPSLKNVQAWKFYTFSGFLNTASVFFHFVGLNYGDLSIVTPLSSMAPLFALLFSRVFFKDEEKITILILIGTLLIVLGGAIISWRIF
tara:strand:+ start:3771 stop:4652 length:882 start_codon:yes stop_codon:yes gene_type:complete